MPGLSRFRANGCPSAGGGGAGAKELLPITKSAPAKARLAARSSEYATKARSYALPSGAPSHSSALSEMMTWTTKSSEKNDAKAGERAAEREPSRRHTA
jgi:hypothetical protein